MKLMIPDAPLSIRRLLIGGEASVQGWEVLNADPALPVDHICNANDLSQFPDGTFAEIYASHVLEHLDYMGELQNALKEWRRILISGGTLYVAVPDLDVLADLFRDKTALTEQERFIVMQMIFGGHQSKYDYHLVGLNMEFLGRFLQWAGFVDIRRVAKFGLFDDTSSMLYKGRLISLNMIARKAGA